MGEIGKPYALCPECGGRSNKIRNSPWWDDYWALYKCEKCGNEFEIFLGPKREHPVFIHYMGGDDRYY